MRFHIYQSTADNYWVAAFNGWAKGVSGAGYRAEMKKWCKESFGSAENKDINAALRWKDEIMWGEVSFKDKKDLEWFLLRWS